MNKYRETYSDFSNTALIKILSETNKYESEAIEAAQLEVDYRQITNSELNKIREGLENQEKIKQTKLNNSRRKKDTLKNYIFSIVDILSPIQKNKQTPERLIKLIVLIYCLFFIYNLFISFDFIRYLLSDSQIDLISLTDYIIPLIILPISLFLFWKKNKYGWVLLSIFLIKSSINYLVLFIMTANMFFHETNTDFIILPEFNLSPAKFFGNFIFFGASLFMICKQKIRSIYSVSNSLMNIIIILITGMIIFQVMSL